jgi:hypothetical protein
MTLPMYQGENKGQSASRAHQRRRARQSRMAEGLPGQSGAQHHGHQSQRRAQLPAGAHAHVLSSPTTRFASWYCSLKPRPRKLNRSFRPSLDPSPIRRARMARRPVHQPGRAVPEVPHGPATPRTTRRLRAEFPAGAGSPAFRPGPSAGSPIRPRSFPARPCLRVYSAGTGITGFSMAPSLPRCSTTPATRRTCWFVICLSSLRRNKARLSGKTPAASKAPGGGK